MRRLLQILFLLVVTFLYTSCGDTGTATEEAIPHDFTTAPTAELSQIIENTPRDFTWGFYNDNIEITLHDDPKWNGGIVISGFQVKNGEVVNEITSEVIETNADELGNGISTADIYSESTWFPGERWISMENNWIPSTTWFPGERWAPAEMQNVAMSRNDLAENETLVVVYAHVPVDSAKRKQETRPLGIVFQKREPTTGTLKAITTTNGGRDDSGYTLTVDSGNSTAMDTADTAYVSGISEGSHQAELSKIPSDCSLSGQNPRSISITAGDTTSTTFEISCQIKLKKQVAFHSARNSDPEIYVMNTDGSDQHSITSNSEFDSSPAISHDGTKIAFVSGRNSGQHLFVMNVDGSGAKQLTTASTDPGFHSWSPDDKKIVFADYDGNGREIYKIHADGSGRTKLTNNSTDDAFPTWSPDGNKIAFVSNRNGNPQVFTMNTDGSSIQQITTGVALDSYSPAPRWSPDGSKLVILLDDGSIHTINSDGSNMKEVTGNSHYDYSPAWSADGSEIIFSRDGNLTKINADGSGSATELTTTGRDDEPFWSPLQ